MALSLAPDGVTINNLLPGPFDTERLASYFATVARTKGVSDDEARRAFMVDVPARRPGSARLIPSVADVDHPGGGVGR
jgi:3-oxoacyl-[acyl-carrier protein] reductase